MKTLVHIWKSMYVDPREVQIINRNSEDNTVKIHFRNTDYYTLSCDDKEEAINLVEEIIKNFSKANRIMTRITTLTYIDPEELEGIRTVHEATSRWWGTSTEKKYIAIILFRNAVALSWYFKNEQDAIDKAQSIVSKISV